VHWPTRRPELAARTWSRLRGQIGSHLERQCSSYAPATYANFVSPPSPGVPRTCPDPRSVIAPKARMSKPLKAASSEGDTQRHTLIGPCLWISVLDSVFEFSRNYVCWLQCLDLGFSKFLIEICNGLTVWQTTSLRI